MPKSIDKNEMLSDDNHSRSNSDDEDDEYCGTTSDDSSETDDLDECNSPSTSKESHKKQFLRKTVRIAKDDGNEQHFIERIRNYTQEMFKVDDASTNGSNFHEFKDDYRISNSVWNKLYKYQKTGVKWLYELHNQSVGGILADEMGLGKTIQVCVFLRSLAESQQKSKVFKYKGLGPTLMVCPATVLHQWVKELNSWFPLCKAAVLHSSGSHSGSKNNLIRKMTEYRSDGSILITTYSTYLLEYKKLLNVNWHYVILDEGHKIRNPEAKITLMLKELRTPHRIIVSGSPLQNNLKELWSLIDFIYPGRLSSLKEFIEKFSIPISQGGYANATAIQVRTAYKCACILRDAINPYLLRRMKNDVQMVLQLPEKTEQILFCDITSEQRKIYLNYIESKVCKEIIAGSQIPFTGLMYLRKLCNHPDLVTGGPNKFNDSDVMNDPELHYGYYKRSGKMIVLQTLLKLWFEQGQKVLLFSQSRQMLTIIEQFIMIEGYEYLRMDGTTPIGNRHDLVTTFNNNKEIFIFLLTTKVGGLGINLTGANRVLIYDPDWNPSTDTQARERAWRIGQHRPVTIYRLLTSGTIEEKIYQRQIFKHFLANRVLVNPKQQRFFKTTDLHELFSLGSSKIDKKCGTETAAIFSEKIYKNKFLKEQLEKRCENVSENLKYKEVNSMDDSLKKMNESDEDGDIGVCELTEETKNRLRDLAKKYAKKFNNFQLLPSDNREEKPNSKTKKHSLFEGKYEIPMLKKQKSDRQMINTKNNEKMKNTTKINREQDDYVLKKLLHQKEGKVHSTLHHDQIVTNTSVADIQLIEDEANAVAKRAADVLKRSKREHHRFLANVSEFSSLAPKALSGSRFGQKRAAEFVEMSNFVAVKEKRSSTETADDPEPVTKEFDGSCLLKINNGLNKNGDDLLRSICQRKERQLDNPLQESNDDEILDYPSLSAQMRSNVLPFGDKYEKLTMEIRDFLAVNNGRAYTNDILSRFRDKIPATDVFVFRSILKYLCNLMPKSLWVLKDEFI